MYEDEGGGGGRGEAAKLYDEGEYDCPEEDDEFCHERSGGGADPRMLMEENAELRSPDAGGGGKGGFAAKGGRGADAEESRFSTSI